MGISERKERQKAELRETILAAARRIFIQEGAEALTMRHIAEAIEYSPGTIYLYFSSREDIAFALVREGFAKLLAALSPAQTIPDPVERIRTVGRAYIAFGLADPETYKLIFMTNAKYVYAALTPATDASPDDPGQRAFDILVEAIREAVRSGQFRAVDIETCAQAFVAGVHGVLSLHITCPMMIADATSVAELVQDALLRGLCA
jgi:AcrR family transcriptional regulator